MQATASFLTMLPYGLKGFGINWNLGSWKRDYPFQPPGNHCKAYTYRTIHDFVHDIHYCSLLSLVVYFFRNKMFREGIEPSPELLAPTG